MTEKYNVRLNASTVYSATSDAHQRHIFLCLPPLCGGLKGYTLPAGVVARIQPHGSGSNPV